MFGGFTVGNLATRAAGDKKDAADVLRLGASHVHISHVDTKLLSAVSDKMLLFFFFLLFCSANEIK